MNDESAVREQKEDGNEAASGSHMWRAK
jgi:hypothetical protein